MDGNQGNSGQGRHRDDREYGGDALHKEAQQPQGYTYGQGQQSQQQHHQSQQHQRHQNFPIDPSLQDQYYNDRQPQAQGAGRSSSYSMDLNSASSSKRPLPEWDNDDNHDQGDDTNHAASGSGNAENRPKARTKARKSEPRDDNESELGASSMPATGGGDGGGGPGGPKRAAQACVRCRKQKLRCLGGWPCNRCSKAKIVCDFGRPGPGGGGAANARLEQLESSVANLLAGLAGSGNGVDAGIGAAANKLASLVGTGILGEGGAGAMGGAGPSGPSKGGAGGGGRNAGPYPNGEILHTFDPTARTAYSVQPRRFSSTSRDGSGQWDPAVSSAPAIPPPTHSRQIDPPRFGTSLTGPGSNSTNTNQEPSPVDEQIRFQQVRFGSSPSVSFLPAMTSPSQNGSSAHGPSPGSVMTGRSDEVHEARTPGQAPKRGPGKGQKAEERLAAATEGGFEPPFKALVYQPSVWDNREQSRRNSPQPSNQSRDEISAEGTYDKRLGRDRDDPVNTEIVDLATAETLFHFFIDHCHPFLPIVNVALDDAFVTIRQAPPLISAMIAIAARFYPRFTARNPGTYPPLDPTAPRKLANLAESHLAQSLLRKQHALTDVQATILLAAWGLQSGGRGPDSWVVTGHAVRVARRLGVHKILGQAAELARNSRPGTPAWDTLSAFMPQWRTWLGWFSFDGFLSLGFGRPQSTQFETVDEQGFLQVRLNQPIPRPGTTQSLSLYGDIYIAGQVQLTQIGRDLVNWGEMLADPERAIRADPRRADMLRDRDLRVLTMFRELNGRLDEWCKLWVWSGSPYTMYLGSSARIARLQAEHMRLCLNSFALKSAPEQDEMVSSFLKKALNAAKSTIQTHFESSQTDLALSFATDYLTITLAQAAIFLIRLTHLPPSVQKTINVETSVVAHYLQISIDLLRSGDMSETRLSTYLAKTIRDIARAAGILIPGLGGEEDAPSRAEEAVPGDGAYQHPGGAAGSNNQGQNPAAGSGVQSGAGGNAGYGLDGTALSGMGSEGYSGGSSNNNHKSGGVYSNDSNNNGGMGGFNVNYGSGGENTGMLNQNAFASGSGSGSGSGQGQATGLDQTPFNPSAMLGSSGGHGGGMPPSAFQLNPNGSNASANPFDLDNFLEIESQMDLGYLLGLPGDGTGFGFDSVQVGNGEGEWSNHLGEFGFGMGLGGTGMGIEGMGFDLGGGGGSGGAGTGLGGGAYGNISNSNNAGGSSGGGNGGAGANDQ